AHVEPALALVESVRGRALGDLFRTSFSGSVLDAYQLQIDILMSLHAKSPGSGFAVRAFEASERARARGLLDLLRESRVEVRGAIDGDLAERERRLRQTLNAKVELRQRLLASRTGAAGAAEVEREIVLLLTQYGAAEARISSQDPWYAELTQPEPLRLAELQAWLDDGTVLVEYSLGARHSVLWWITATSFEAFELPPRAVLAEAARRAAEALSVPDPGRLDERHQALENLGRLLLTPLAGRLSGQRLAVVADGPLQHIPFAALPAPGGGDPLLVRHEVVHLPSAGVLRELRRKPVPAERPLGLIALLADPVFAADDPRVSTTEATAGSPTEETPFERLVWTRREAEAITALADPSQVFLALDFDASRETLTGPRAGHYRILHLATHGVIDSENPALSGVVLSRVDPQGRSRDGFLHLTDLYSLKISAGLVVLSGCRTALGKEIRGEGLVGLTRGLFRAGASQVVASLWAVRDRATAELMRRFYSALLRDGLKPAAALREAQLSLRAEPRWRDPYFWAPFTVQGDWTRQP
ncbi:MAG TPA: CHAT domain-containing protein, partial [Thermoanaerobaculia bacterium]|nr:CHAT domain-containing protein [Thermoanaerobaculia bacterium]